MIINGPCISVPEQRNFGKYILHHFQQAKPLDVCLENYGTGEQLTYAGFTEYAVSLSVALTELGVTKGDVVAVGSEKRITFLPTTLAVVLTGAAFTPFDLQTGRAVLSHKLNLAQPNYFICSELFWKAYGDVIKGYGCIKAIICFEDITDVNLSIKKLMSKPLEVKNFEPATVEGQTDTALILYSSGTTGLPKGVPITHLSCVLNSWNNEFHDESLKTVFMFGEWYHSYDIFNGYAILCAGKKIVFTDTLKSDTADFFLKLVNDCQVDLAVIVPSLLFQLAKGVAATSSLKRLFVGASPLHPTVVEKIKTRFPNLESLTKSYGMTEVGGITSDYWCTKGFKVESVGMAYPTATIKIVDPETRKIMGPNQRGEICVRSPRLMRGYIGMDSAAYFDDEGFFLTGDLGYFDEDSYLYFVGRIKEVIFYDGYQVSPLELETILLSHPGVREAAVVGKPAGEFGEEPAAFVVRQPDAAVTEQELVDYVTSEVTTYMQLRGGVKFITELPRNSTRKVLRHQLKEILQEKDGLN